MNKRINVSRNNDLLIYQVANDTWYWLSVNGNKYKADVIK